MAPKKNRKNNKKNEKPVDFTSPASKRKITINSKARMRRGLNLIQAINAVADTAPTVVYTALQQRVIDRARSAKDKKLPFDDFAVQHRFHLRQQGGETGLTQLEWEELTASRLLQSVVLSRPNPRVGELLKNSTLYERTEFYKAVTKQENIMKRYGHSMVEDALETARKISEARALAAKKVKEEVKEEEGMVPEF